MPKATGIDLTIYNAIGQKVRTLVSGYAEAGKHKIQWDARDDKGYEMASGVYIYRFSTKEFSKNREDDSYEIVSYDTNYK